MRFAFIRRRLLAPPNANRERFALSLLPTTTDDGKVFFRLVQRFADIVVLFRLDYTMLCEKGELMEPCDIR